MKKYILFSAITLFVIGLQAQNKFKVTPDEARNGSYTISPTLPKDGMVKAGTVLTLKATPATGYIFDSGYYSLPEQWGLCFMNNLHLSSK